MVRTETYFIDGKEVEIIYETNQNEDTDAIKRLILDLCTNFDICKAFPKLTFILKLLDNKNAGEVTRKDLEEGKRIVYINAIPETIKNLKFTAAVIRHEIAHIYNYEKSKAYRDWPKIIKKFKLIIDASNIEQSIKKVESFDARIILAAFIRKLIGEGLGAYFNLFTNKTVIYHKKNFEIFYSLGLKSAINIKSAWDQYKKTKNQHTFKKLTEALSMGEYTIGLHIIYSILFLNREAGLDYLFALEPMKCIQEYERLMRAKKDFTTDINTPLVSISSKKGIIDYSTLLKELNT